MHITGVNLKVVGSAGFSKSYEEDMHAEGGSEFNYTLTLPNDKKWIMNVNLIQVDTAGFSIASDTQYVPFTIPAGSSNTFTLTIMAPDKDYSGPIDISVYTL